MERLGYQPGICTLLDSRLLLVMDKTDHTQ